MQRQLAELDKRRLYLHRLCLACLTAMALTCPLGCSLQHAARLRHFQGDLPVVVRMPCFADGRAGHACDSTMCLVDDCSIVGEAESPLVTPVEGELPSMNSTADVSWMSTPPHPHHPLSAVHSAAFRRHLPATRFLPVPTRPVFDWQGADPPTTPVSVEPAIP